MDICELELKRKKQHSLESYTRRLNWKIDKLEIERLDLLKHIANLQGKLDRHEQ